MCLDPHGLAPHHRFKLLQRAHALISVASDTMIGPVQVLPMPVPASGWVERMMVCVEPMEASGYDLLAAIKPELSTIQRRSGAALVALRGRGIFHSTVEGFTEMADDVSINVPLFITSVAHDEASASAASGMIETMLRSVRTQCAVFALTGKLHAVTLPVPPPPPPPPPDLVQVSALKAVAALGLKVDSRFTAVDETAAPETSTPVSLQDAPGTSSAMNTDSTGSFLTPPPT